MTKKKKLDEDNFEDFDFEDDEQDIDENDSMIDDDLEDDSPSVDFNDDTPVNPMGLATQISKESETVKQFKDLPRETRYSFLTPEDKDEVKHHARSYRNWKYIEKIIQLRMMEDEEQRQNKSFINKVKSRDDFIEYLNNTNQEYMIPVIENLSKEDLDQVLKHIEKHIKPNYMMETIEKSKDKMRELYEEYEETNEIPNYIDDMDNLGKVVDTSIISMGFKGNAAQHSVMTIQAVKNEDIEKKAESESSFSLLDSIKRRFG